MSGVRRWLPRIISGLALAAVSAVTGIISYSHIYTLTLTLHQPVMVARLMPFGVDGLIVVGSVVLLQPPARQRWLGWIGVGPGAGISLFANVESGVRYGVLAAAWAGIPAVAFSLATFMLERWLKGHAEQAVPAVPAALNGHGRQAAEMFAADLAEGKVPGVRAIKKGLGVGQPIAQQVRAYLHTLTST